MPRRTIFAYPRTHFLVRSAFLFALLVSMMVFTLVFSDIGLLWPSLLLFIFVIFILLTNISPMFTRHEITGDRIILRNGILYTGSFGFDQIESVQRSRSGFRLGRIVLASGASNRVSIKLKTKVRFSRILYRKSDEIIIDLIRPDEFVELANARLSQVGLAPIQADRPGPQFGNEA